jgi:phosphate transport system substrate-binding protein
MMMNLKTVLIGGLVAAGLAIGTAQAGGAVSVDPKLPDYKRTSGISGNLTSIGSDTLNNMMTLWAEGFQGEYPNVNIQVQGAGSSTAPPAVTEGTANLGPMSRAMKQGEIQAFEQKHGYPPTEVRVAIDMLAVYVHRDNPIEGMSIPQVDAVFSSTRRCGGAGDITRWGQLGLTGAWANRDFALYSRNAVSGTYGYFKEKALCDGDFKASINEQPGSASVVQGVSESINGIGYSGIGYMTSGVRAVPLSREDGGKFIPASAEYAATGEYPMARFLYVYVNKHPTRGLSPLEREFLKMVLSKQGQEVVVRDGYIPLPAAAAEQQLKNLGIM